MGISSQWISIAPCKTWDLIMQSAAYPSFTAASMSLVTTSFPLQKQNVGAQVRMHGQGAWCSPAIWAEGRSTELLYLLHRKQHSSDLKACLSQARTQCTAAALVGSPNIISLAVKLCMRKQIPGRHLISHAGSKCHSMPFIAITFSRKNRPLPLLNSIWIKV